jgi:ketosteroid isomerase-like protein
MLSRSRLNSYLALLALTLATFTSTIKTVAFPQSATSETDAIKSQIAKYAQSIDAADTTLASQVWLDSPDVSFIHPLGHEHGFTQIKQNVYTRLMGETFSERHLSVHDVIVHVYSDTAWAEFYWDFGAKLRKASSPITTHGRETQVYHRDHGTWRLVHVHYSAPVTTQQTGL